MLHGRRIELWPSTRIRDKIDVHKDDDQKISNKRIESAEIEFI